MKKLTLDISKWRCGGNGENKIGDGRTKLLNDEGFMCCLGQFSLQLGATEKDIKNCYYPYNINFKKRIKKFTKPDGSDTALTLNATTLNDDEKLTTKQRIWRLKKLFKNHGFEIEIIGNP